MLKLNTLKQAESSEKEMTALVPSKNLETLERLYSEDVLIRSIATLTNLAVPNLL